MNIGSRFQSLLGAIAPSEREVADYRTHKRTVESAIEDDYPGAQCTVIGSHARGSAIGGASDLDLLARLPRAEVRRSADREDLISSDTVLRNVGSRLKERFRNTEIGRDEQVVVVSFANGTRDIDVVPAAFAGMIHVPFVGAKRPLFLIPDGGGSWITTSPQAHNDFLDAVDRTAGGKLKYIAQLLRYWKRCRTPPVPMSTFHAELVLAQAGTCRVARSYSHTLADCFIALAKRRGQALQDPLGISGFVPLAATSAKRDQARAALDYAAEHASKAVALEDRGRFAEAHDQWSIVFNREF